MGFFRIELGRNLLGVEENFAWATPNTWMSDGDDCHNTYIDASRDVCLCNLDKYIYLSLELELSTFSCSVPGVVERRLLLISVCTVLL